MRAILERLAALESVLSIGLLEDEEGCRCAEEQGGIAQVGVAGHGEGATNQFYRGVYPYARVWGQKGAFASRNMSRNTW